MNYELSPDMNSQGFESYYRTQLVQKWKNNYYPYSQVKDQISNNYKMFVDRVRDKKGGDGRKVTIMYSGDDEDFNGFIRSIDTLIVEEFSKVR